MKLETKVTICLPTRNRAEYLRQTIAAILTQTFAEFTLLIVDDASTDETADVVGAFNDPRIRYARNQVSLGIPGVLNACARSAKSKYFLILHDHDVYAPTLVAEMVALLDEHPTAAYVHPGVYEASESGEFVQSHVAAFPPLMRGRDLARIMLRSWSGHVSALSMVRRSFLDRQEPYDPRFGFLSDTDLWVRLAIKHDVAYIPKPIVGLRPRESDHPFNRPNWLVPQWAAEVLRVNVQRFHEGRLLRLWIALRVCRLRRDYLMLQTLFRCCYRRQLDTFEEGLDILARDEAIELRATSWLVRRFTPLQASIRGAAMLARVLRPR